MFYRVAAYYNRDMTYSETSILRIVGEASFELPQEAIHYDICEVVYALLNERGKLFGLHDKLFPVARRFYIERLRSMRTGDVVTVWAAENPDWCARMRSYEVRAFGFREIERESSLV